MSEEAFVFSREERTVWWPVVVNVPVDEGRTEPRKCRVKFTVIEKSEFASFKGMSQENARQKMASYARDWDVIDEKGKAVPFSAENFAAALRMGFFELAITKALMQIAHGARAGN